MRAYAAIVAVVATLALAGCSSSREPEPNSPVDPEKAEASDYVVPSIIVGVAAITGLALLGVLLLVRRRRRGQTGPPGAGLPPPGKPKGP